jgi:hypothetical protein
MAKLVVGVHLQLVLLLEVQVALEQSRLQQVFDGLERHNL